MELDISAVKMLEPPAQPLAVTSLAPGVRCLHGWHQDWGRNQQREALHNYEGAVRNLARNYPNGSPYGPVIVPYAFTEKWARTRIDEALTRIGKGLVIAAFPNFRPYNKNAALLREYGFRLLGGKCYPNATYPMAQYTGVKGGIYNPDGYQHWIHIWVKDLGGLENCGASIYGLLPQAAINQGAPGVLAGNAGAPAPAAVRAVNQEIGWPNCCGLRYRLTTLPLAPGAYAPANDPNKWLSICQLPADQKFPKGWRRFALYKDFKWGINFTSPAVQGVQDCPHEFDLARIEAWELEQPLQKIY